MDRYKIYINGREARVEFAWLCEAVAYANSVLADFRRSFQSVTVEIVRDSNKFRLTTFNN